MAKPNAAQRKLTVTETLDLRFLPDEGITFDEPLELPWLEAQLADVRAGEPEFRLAGPGHVRLEIIPLGPVPTRPPIRIQGALSASVTTSCVRCLQSVSQALDTNVDLTLFAKARDAATSRLEGEDAEALNPHQLDEGIYEQNTLDLPAIIREALLLEIAMNPRCEDESACSSRTRALLEDANRAAEQALEDDRWSGLRRWMTRNPPFDGGKKPSN